MNSKKTFLWAAAVLFLLIAADQLTKQLAVQYLYQNEPVEIIPGVFELQFLINKGAAFGIMQNHQYFFCRSYLYRTVCSGLGLCKIRFTAAVWDASYDSCPSDGRSCGKSSGSRSSGLCDRFLLFQAD